MTIAIAAGPIRVPLALPGGYARSLPLANLSHPSHTFLTNIVDRPGCIQGVGCGVQIPTLLLSHRLERTTSDMPRSSDVLDEARVLIEQRIRELDEEKARLERTLAGLTDGESGRRGPGRPRGSGSSARRRGRKRGRKRATRADQATKTVAENPGITTSEIARKLKIQPNYMYRVMGELEEEGRVAKKGKGY